jgi:hypothetical protein
MAPLALPWIPSDPAQHMILPSASCHTLPYTLTCRPMAPTTEVVETAGLLAAVLLKPLIDVEVIRYAALSEFISMTVRDLSCGFC